MDGVRGSSDVAMSMDTQDDPGTIHEGMGEGTQDGGDEE